MLTFLHVSASLAGICIYLILLTVHVSSSPDTVCNYTVCEFVQLCSSQMSVCLIDWNTQFVLLFKVI